MKLRTLDMILIALFAALTAVGAFIKVPIPVVPFTLQYLFCALGAVILGGRKGALAQLLYVGIGLIGVPVFTQGGGPQYILQPTFGYLIGFILGAYAIGKITERYKVITTKIVFFTSLVGLSIIYFFGVVYLYFIQNFYLGITMSWSDTIYVGFVVCVGADIILTIIISLITPKIVSTVKKVISMNVIN